jgi:hypothetical protein
MPGVMVRNRGCVEGIADGEEEEIENKEMGDGI